LRETRSRFILTDPETDPLIKQGVQLVDWHISAIAFGQVQGATSVETLLSDDGSGMIF